MNRDDVIGHLQIMHTWATFALENDRDFFNAGHMKSIAEWTSDAIALLKDQEGTSDKERKKELVEKMSKRHEDKTPEKAKEDLGEVTLENSLEKLMALVQDVKNLEAEINDLFGVDLIVNMISSGARCEIITIRGIEEVEKALVRKSKLEPLERLYRTIDLKNEIRFVQYAVDKSKTFVKAWEEPPEFVLE